LNQTIAQEFGVPFNQVDVELAQFRPEGVC
jgi:hypothetical protein